MNFLETGLTRNRGRGMFMQRTKVSRQVQLFVNVDCLVTENYWTVQQCLSESN
jgi:hypothetical protein